MTSTPAPLTTFDIIRTAEALEKQAKSLRTEALKLTETMSRHEANKNFMDKLVAYGMDAAKANNWRKTGLDSGFCATFFPEFTPKETALHYTRKACDAEKFRLRAQRDREIMRRARRGETNQEISNAVGVSTRTISKIISETLRLQNALLIQTIPDRQPPRRRLQSSPK